MVRAMNSFLINPFILIAGAMQAMGNAMNAQLKNSVSNPWLASVISFALVLVFFIGALFVSQNLFQRWTPCSMPRWAPLGGLVGAVAVFAGLTLTSTVGSGPFIGLTVRQSDARHSGCCRADQSRSRGA